MKNLSFFLLCSFLITVPVLRSSAQACSALSFTAATNFGAGDRPWAITTADFNGDGKLDLAVTNLDVDSISVLLNAGNGSFSAATNFKVGDDPDGIIAGDFNGDGKPDLAVANVSSNNISVLLNNGSGGFGAATNFGVGDTPSDVTVGDFNGDGKLDLANANFNAHNVSVLLGNGSGNFSAAVNYGTDFYPLTIISGDFNGDSKADLATSSFQNDNVSVLLNTGSGSFGAATNFGVGDFPISITTADFNGDGKLDLATANNTSQNVSVLLNTGSGNFGAATNFAAGLPHLSITAADFNKDGKVDLATCREVNSSVLVLLNTGSGFGAPVSFATSNSGAVTSGDFNGDGKPDLATANPASNNVSVLLNSCTASTLPVITCPSNITVNNDAGQCSASVSLTGANAATATGTPTPVISYKIDGTSITSPHTFLKGQTTVTAIATNSVGTDECTFTVTVMDNQQPQIVCPFTGNANRNAGANCTYIVSGTEFNATATDNCGVSSLTYSLSGVTTGTGTTLAGEVLNKGVTTITWTASDGVTTAVTCSFTVTVVDNQQPQITCPLTGNTNRNAGASCTYTVSGTEFNATAIDNCGVSLLTYSLSGVTTGTGTSLTSETLNKGVTTITWTARDGVTTAVTCSFTVTVVDNQQPQITCPLTGNTNRNAGTACNYTVSGTEFDATATDNCSVFSLTYSLSGVSTGTGTTLASEVLNKGVTTITWTASDGVTTAVTCSFTVTVVDNQQPQITCPLTGNTNRNAGTACTYTVSGSEFNATASDNCGVGSSLMYSLSGATTGTGTTLAGKVLNKGVTTITWQASDGVTTTTTCNFTVTVVDNGIPVITTNPNSVVLLWSPNHMYQTVKATQLVTSVTDNCNGSIPVSSVVITKVTSDEPEDVSGNSDGNTKQDIKIASDCKSVDLRRERIEGGNGRVYTIYLSVSDAAGNKATAIAKVYVQANQSSPTAVDNGVAYTVLSKCGGSMARSSNTESLPLNAVEEKTSALKLYPNPSKGQFMIDLQMSEKINGIVKLQLIDISGRTVYFENAAINNGVFQKKISISSMLSSGIYMVKIIVNDKSYLSKLIYEK